MKRIRLKKRPPINLVMFSCYFLFVIYAYARAERIFNNILVMITFIVLIDGIYFFTMIRNIEIKLHIEQMVQKNEVFGLQVSLRNHGLLSTIYIDLVPQEGHRCRLKETGVISVLLKGREHMQYKILYNAHLCGLEEIGLEKIIYKSFFSFFIKEVHIKEKAKIKILPTVNVLSEMEGFTEYISKLLAQEEKQRESSIAMAGEEEVGNELRPYVLGDSQRLVHWKIAAYKGELLVRQREKPHTTRKDVFFILNPFLALQEDERHIVEDKVLTTFVSLVGHYLKQGERVRIAYYKSKKWHYTKVKDSIGLQELKEILSAYRFLNVEETINQRSILKSMLHVIRKKSGVKVVVSNYWTCQMEEYILSKKQEATIPYIWTGTLVPEALIQQSHIKMWHMTDEYSMHLPIETSVGIQEQ